MSIRASGFLLAIILALACFFLTRQSQSLKREAESLRQQLSSAKADPPTVSIVRSESPSSAEKLELMRLRAEVTELRQQLRQAAAQKETRSAAPEQNEEPADRIPLDQWTRAGSSTPAEAAESLFHYLYQLRTESNDVELAASHPPVIIYHIREEDGIGVPEIEKAVAALLPRPDQIAALELGGSRPKPPEPGVESGDQQMPVTIHHQDGGSESYNITFGPMPTVEGGKLNPTGSWGPRIRVSLVDGQPQASFQ